ncbi:hypothetical protein ACFFX0_12300 [Citricoccus parietis]|uniref:Uncharacterized protein n=1 Tax=Citricoccus parietis TaxID=592307 RepID=A0ABV5FZ42_9MICC
MPGAGRTGWEHGSPSILTVDHPVRRSTGSGWAGPTWSGGQRPTPVRTAVHRGGRLCRRGRTPAARRATPRVVGRGTGPPG